VRYCEKPVSHNLVEGRRMVQAASGGQADVLGHCTGRLVEGNRGTRPESKFDAEKVFTACRDHGTAVEINSRPERRDPPTRLLTLALEIGCDFSIDTDAHAPGQLDFLGYGAQRALDNDIACLYGDVLPDNHLMLGLVRKYGFSEGRNPADPRLLRVRKTLNPSPAG